MLFHSLFVYIFLTKYTYDCKSILLFGTEYSCLVSLMIYFY